MRRSPAPLAIAVLALASACAGPPIPASIEGIPVCPDFDSGHTKMEGSLRFPVRLRVLDGKDQVSKIVIVGLRKAEDIRPRTYIADANAEYNLEWAQCANERAPRSVADAARETGKGKDKMRESDTAYECGDTTVYKTEKLVTKKGDPASHAVKFVEPPKPACWVGEPPPPPSPPPVADAGAPDPSDAGAAAADAGVASDAGAVATDAGAPADAGAAPSAPGATASPSAKPDAKK